MDSPGDPEVMRLGEWPRPEPQAGEISVRVAATALNRADLLQRRGGYPPPPGASPILGLEMAGVVEQVGASVTRWRPGDRVCGLLSGGGYAEYVVLHQDMALPAPAGLSLEEAAAIPEAFLTAFQALRWLADLQPEETILIHAGASGVGAAATQLARAMEAVVLVTASGSKHPLCLSLGARHAIDYREENFAEEAMALTYDRGVDVIIDFVGGPYFQDNLRALSPDGRLVMLGFLGGVKAEHANLAPILRKRLQIIGSTLRARPPAYKIALTADLRDFAWPLFEKGEIKPVIDTVFPWEEVVAAHRYMEANKNQGKIVLKI